MRKWIRRGIGGLLATVVGLGAGECLARIVPAGAETWRSTTVPAPRWIRPRVEEQPYALAKPPGTFRIGVLGDSYAWGAGVHMEDAWPHRLDRALQRRSHGRPIEVLNAGRAGWNTDNELHTLRTVLLPREPDLVLLGYCLNDPEPTSGNERRASMAELHRRRPERGLAAWLHSASVLFRLAWERAEDRRQRRAFTEHYHRLHAPDQPGFAPFLAALRSIRDELRGRGIPLVLVLLPVFDSPLDERYPYLDLHEQVRGLGHSLGIPVLDLLPAYAGCDPRRLAVEPFTDPHPNELAHRIAADRIEGWLLARHLVPLDPPGGSLSGAVAAAGVGR